MPPRVLTEALAAGGDEAKRRGPRREVRDSPLLVRRGHLNCPNERLRS
jgi:hypothetical protein